MTCAVLVTCRLRSLSPTAPIHLPVALHFYLSPHLFSTSHDSMPPSARLTDPAALRRPPIGPLPLSISCLVAVVVIFSFFFLCVCLSVCFCALYAADLCFPLLFWGEGKYIPLCPSIAGCAGLCFSLSPLLPHSASPACACLFVRDSQWQIVLLFHFRL